MPEDETIQQSDSTPDSTPSSSELDASTPDPEVTLPDGAIQNLTEGVEGGNSADGVDD
jgi:hypothetical protein